jgi:hypothetical protein
MKKIILTSILTGLVALGGIAQAKDTTESDILQEENKVFVAVMGPVSFADAYGSRETGPHGTFGSFPANFETPEHVHSHSYRAIVVKGEMTNPFAGEKSPPVMTPGSYWAVEAGAVHTTACVSSIPCEFFMYSNEGFDFVTTK